MIRVFVSYRRQDSRHQAGASALTACMALGPEQIFKDVDSIPLTVWISPREVPDRAGRRL